MKEFGYTAFLVVFSGNVLLQFGIVPGSAKGYQVRFAHVLPLVLVSAAYTFILALVQQMVILPFRLFNIMPVLYGLLYAVSLGVYRLIKRFRKSASAGPETADSWPALYSLLVYSVFLAVGYQDASAWFLAYMAIWSILGYVMAAILVNDISARVALQPVPTSFRGYPILFVNLALVALALSGLNEFFLYRLVE